MKKIEITQAKTQGDIERVREFWAEYCAYLKEQLADHMGNQWLIQYFKHFDEEIEDLNVDSDYSNTEILLIKYDGKNVGCVNFKERGDGTAEINRLYIQENYRGKGIGTKVIQILIEKARQNNFNAIRLKTALPRAKALYKKTGFIEIDPYSDFPLKSLSFFEMSCTDKHSSILRRQAAKPK